MKTVEAIRHWAHTHSGEGKKGAVAASKAEPAEDLKPAGVPEAPLLDVSTVGGAVAGAMVGAIAGPIGAIAGGAVGTAVGLIAGATLENEDRRASLHDEELDEQIGVIRGDMGAASPNQPPARIGAYSAGSAGVRRPSRPPSEGPISDLDQDS